MELTITAAAIATIISGLTSAIITLYVNKNTKRKYLDDQLDALLKIALQYPYLESPSFINNWNENKHLGKEDYLRYDIYCNLLFNFLARVAEFYSYDKIKIENYVTAKNWIRLHKECWLNPIDAFENIDSYDKKFKELVAEYLN